MDSALFVCSWLTTGYTGAPGEIACPSLRSAHWIETGTTDQFRFPEVTFKESANPHFPRTRHGVISISISISLLYLMLTLV